MRILALSALLFFFNHPGFGQDRKNPEVDLDLHKRHAEFHNWDFWLSNVGFNFNEVNQAPAPSNSGGFFPKGAGHHMIVMTGFLIGVLKDSIATASPYRYTVSDSWIVFVNESKIPNWAPGSILNENVPFDSLVADDPDSPRNAVWLIDTSRAGDDWINWVIAGGPTDSLGNPLLVSQQDSWAVFNDVDTSRGIHPPGSTDSPIRGIGIEVQQSSYEFGVSPDVVLMRWKFFNHTNVTYDSAYVGIVSDPDIGNNTARNDQAGTDTTTKMIYVYNDNQEFTPTGNQYALAYKLLHVSGDADLSNTSWRTHAFTSEPNKPGFAFDAAPDTARYFNLAGRDWNGSLRLQSEGFVEMDGSPFVFPGDPVTGQGLISDNPSVWPAGADVRTMISVGPFQLNPGTENNFVIAVIGGEAQDRLGAITDLRNEADRLQTLFDNQIGYLLGVSPTFTGPVAEFGVSSTAALPGEDIYFYDWALVNPQDPTTTWKWDFDNDGTIDYQSTNHWNRPKEWSYPDPGVYSVKLVVTDAAGSDSLVKDSLITVYAPIATPFIDDFDAAPEPDPLSWINTTAHVSDKSANPPSSPYALALDSNPDGPEMITSYPFDLSGPAESLADTLLGLRYWYEGKGNGNAPEPDDSLIVEFRNNFGTWIKAREYPGQSMSAFFPDSVFLDSVDPGPGATFYHETFQFRFRGTSTPSSTAPHKDVWFVDDVYFGDIIVGIDPDQTHGIPEKFKLHQNYPNPFNPATTIKYDLPKDSKVTIRIFNVLGQEVRTLVDEPQSAGFRSVVWNGKNDSGNAVSSGVYVYRIEAGSFVQTKKMMLLR